jgi:hypothetical protein
MSNMITLPLLIWNLFWLVVTIACAVAGVFLARMLKRHSRNAATPL